MFHLVQTDSSKFGVICLKIKVRREFFLISHWEYSETASLHHIFTKSIFCFLMMSLLSDIRMQLSV